MNRRSFIRVGAMAGASLAMPFKDVVAAVVPRIPFHVFSKNFMFLTRDELCEIVAEIGMDGVEWCVRGQGHVEPTRVKTEMPLAVEAARKQGLDATMICTRSKGDGTDTTNEGDIVETLKVCADCGVKTWRPGAFIHNEKLSLMDNLKAMEKRFRRLEEISRISGVKCTYQNHFGCFGGGIYDMMGIVREIDPKWFGLQYDILHAVFETPVSWERHLRDAAPFIVTGCLKDCNCLADQKRDMWQTFKTVPAPTGIIPFERYARLLNTLGVCVPHSVHYEFPLPQDDRKVLAAELKRELDYFKRVMVFRQTNKENDSGKA